MPKVYFDSSLKVCASVLSKFIDPRVLSNSVIIRDINGQLGVVINEKLKKRLKDKLSSNLILELNNYARPYNIVADKNDFGAESIIYEASLQKPLLIDGIELKFIDRRVVGVDWQNNTVVDTIRNLPCFVFASIKGGVGRSTALCVAAAHLSQKGYRILAIDFDLEAPGIGSMLLKETELPPLGSLDFLVEAQVSGFSADLIPQLVGSSYLGSSGGRVDIVPAIGKMTLDNPHDALAKIARAYLEISPEDGGPLITLGGKLRKLVELCTDTGMYDIVLVDSRAGLHETTAAAMLALGGELLLFGTDQPQTFQGYSLLFGHLSQLSNEQRDNLLSKITFVHAKANRSEKAKQNSEVKFKELYDALLGQPNNSNIEEDLGKEDIDVIWNDDASMEVLDESSEVNVLHIFDDSEYNDFDPLLYGNLLEYTNYSTTFADLISFLDEEILESPEEAL